MQNLLLSVLSSDRKKADIQCICNTTYAVRQWQWSVLGGVKWPMNSFTSVLDSWYLMDKSCLGCTWPGGSQGILVLINKRQHVFLFFDLLLKPTMFRKGFKNQCRNRFTFVLWAGLCRIPSGTWERWIRCPPPDLWGSGWGQIRAVASARRLPVLVSPSGCQGPCGELQQGQPG
jgi:hypothetical protein